jgi:hypothetical protein
MVDLVGIEPTTSSMPWKRAPSCATGPQWYSTILADQRCIRQTKGAAGRPTRRIFSNTMEPTASIFVLYTGRVTLAIFHYA